MSQRKAQRCSLRFIQRMQQLRGLWQGLHCFLPLLSGSTKTGLAHSQGYLPEAAAQREALSPKALQELWGTADGEWGARSQAPLAGSPRRTNAAVEASGLSPNGWWHSWLWRHRGPPPAPSLLVFLSPGVLLTNPLLPTGSPASASGTSPGASILLRSPQHLGCTRGPQDVMLSMGCTRMPCVQ